jgi:hypothetical protein
MNAAFQVALCLPPAAAALAARGKAPSILASERRCRNPTTSMRSASRLRALFATAISGAIRCRPLFNAAIEQLADTHLGTLRAVWSKEAPAIATASANPSTMAGVSATRTPTGTAVARRSNRPEDCAREEEALDDRPEFAEILHAAIEHAERGQHLEFFGDGRLRSIGRAGAAPRTAEPLFSNQRGPATIWA